jgi:phosphoglycerol transferase MdoB-like AlkP superfamily enzyme
MIKQFLPARFRSFFWIALIFIAVNIAVRILLAVLETNAPHSFAQWITIFAVGFLYDLIAASNLLIPFALLALCFSTSARGNRLYGITSSVLLVFALAGMAFVVVAEILFWNEFNARFNFIAVDYLIYSREVLGNIRESYPLGIIFPALFGGAAAVFLLIRKPFFRLASGEGGRFSIRAISAAIIIALPVMSFAIVSDNLREIFTEPGARELSGDGYFEFMHAFRANDLDYFAYYPVMPKTLAKSTLQGEFSEAKSRARFVNRDLAIERDVVAKGPENKLNVVLVSMESHGADFVGALGDKRGLSPFLDQIANEGMLFTQMYATGLRTVRGLEALTLSLPPTPGHAVLMRSKNKGMATLGGVFKDEEYDALYLYGGYSYFDNMRDFFSGNGYTVIDRTALTKDEITHENVWGVADEDMFRRAMKELDTRTATGKKVFVHVMTTSNHRPFTYPEKRIDIASGTSREGAAKYADWAIGALIREAKSHAWFDNTIFVFVADHTSHGRGRMDLPPENYHIPMIIYAPKWIKPATIDYVSSQIDVGPTILSLLNFSYRSSFFGQDILTEGRFHQRALMANYLTVGYMENGKIVELGPKQKVRVVDAASGKILANTANEKELIDETISYYQIASETISQTARR